MAQILPQLNLEEVEELPFGFYLEEEELGFRLLSLRKSLRVLSSLLGFFIQNQDYDISEDSDDSDDSDSNVESRLVDMHRQVLHLLLDTLSQQSHLDYISRLVLKCLIQTHHPILHHKVHINDLLLFA